MPPTRRYTPPSPGPRVVFHASHFKNMSARSGRTAKAKPEAPKPAPPPKTRTSIPPILWIAIAGIVAAAGVVAVLAWPTARQAEIPAVAGTEPGLVTRVQSLYNDIYVYRQPDGDLVLTFGAKRLRYVESIVNPKDELDLPVYYTQSMTAGLAYAAGLDDAAIIGLGGGRTAWYHHKSMPDLQDDRGRARPGGRPPRRAVFRGEAGAELRHRHRRRPRLADAERQDAFDIILIDAYRGPFVPFHLLTTEFYKLVAAHLKPGGVAVQNVEPSTMLFDSAVATIKSAFAHVVFSAGDGNIVIVAYNGPEKDDASVKKLAEERQAHYGLRYDLTRILDRRYQPTWNETTAPLTDDFAPVEYLKAIDRHNEKQT